MKHRDSEAGFSLVETLVSLMIIAAMSGLLFETIGASARFAEQVANRRKAVLVAQSLLDAATASGRSVADTGRTDDLSWRITHIPRSGGGARDTNVPLEEIRVVVADRRSGKSLASVRTLRLAR